jgi:3-methyladenine DNA glycosylase/8-oxoguanine DNA glycosylase
MSTLPVPTQLSTLLATDRLSMADSLDAVPLIDRDRRGAIALRVRPGLLRRAEPGPVGPLVLEATQRGEQVDVAVWGPAPTPPDAREQALEAARAWVGWHDEVPDLPALTAGHPLLQQAARRIGTVRLSRLPRVGEAVGRAVLSQLVQGVEAHRSIAQLAAAAGEPATPGLWTWPTPTALGHTPAYAMRRCGISLRSASALHASALDDPRLDRLRGEFSAFDRRLRAIAGIGAWTSAETRLALGDPDAVSVGDYNLPGMVCHALAGAGPQECTDELMLQLLEPYRGQRGRVIQLVVRAARHRLLPRARRRAPRAALSAHRYW